MDSKDPFDRLRTSHESLFTLLTFSRCLSVFEEEETEEEGEDERVLFFFDNLFSLAALFLVDVDNCDALFDSDDLSIVLVEERDDDNASLESCFPS